MPTTPVYYFKDIIDLPTWRPSAPTQTANSVGQTMAYDLRNGPTNHPINYLLGSVAIFDAYNPYTNEWVRLASPGLAGTFGAGASCIFHPTQGPRGTLASGATTSQVTLSTALPAAVGVNQLANRGDGVGFTLRIIGNSAGSSGKIEERRIIANTGGTTPVLDLETPLTFTPAAGDSYEFLSGRVFLLSAGTVAAGVWKYYDILTNSYSGNLSTTNLPASLAVDSSLIALSEGHVPCDKYPGIGFMGIITASAADSTHITGSSMWSNLAADEYRNFQIRIVEDTATPTAVGQRRVISAHGAGASGQFTVAAWAVTPSATAKFVVENDDDKILLFNNTTSVYTYNVASNAWNTSTFAVAPAAGAAGIMTEQAFGIVRDVSANVRHSHIYRFRGGATSNLDLLDIAAGATGVWSAAIVYGGSGPTFTTGSCGAYDPVTLGGRYFHINHNATQRFLRFDLQNRVLEAETFLSFPQSTAVVGGRMSFLVAIDGSTKLGFIMITGATQVYTFQLAIQR